MCGSTVFDRGLVFSAFCFRYPKLYSVLNDGIADASVTLFCCYYCFLCYFYCKCQYWSSSRVYLICLINQSSSYRFLVIILSFDLSKKLSSSDYSVSFEILNLQIKSLPLVWQIQTTSGSKTVLFDRANF